MAKIISLEERLRKELRASINRLDELNVKLEQSEVEKEEYIKQEKRTSNIVMLVILGTVFSIAYVVYSGLQDSQKVKSPCKEGEELMLADGITSYIEEDGLKYIYKQTSVYDMDHKRDMKKCVLTIYDPKYGSENSVVILDHTCRGENFKIDPQSDLYVAQRVLKEKGYSIKSKLNEARKRALMRHNYCD